MTGTDTERFADVGRRLLAYELMVALDELRTAFHATHDTVRAGKTINHEDVQELEHALERAWEVVDAVADASPADRTPRMAELLTDDELQAVADRNPRGETDE